MTVGALGKTRIGSRAGGPALTPRTVTLAVLGLLSLTDVLLGRLPPWIRSGASPPGNRHRHLGTRNARGQHRRLGHTG